jgi:hypothetical protein
MSNKYIIKEDGRPDRVDEAQIWWDAYRIADPGASNPVAVAGTLAAASGALLRNISQDDVKKHPALRVMAGQLAYLYGVGKDGPSSADMNEVDQKFKAQERMRSTDVCPFCQVWGENPCRMRPDYAIASGDHDGRPTTIERDYSIYGGDN